MIRKLGMTVLGVGLVVVACGGDDEPVAKYPTPDSFCAAKADEECKVVAAGCTVSVDQCKTARKNACNTANGAATSQGRAYKSANAENCIAKTAEVYKDRTIDPVKEAAFIEACGRVFQGAKKKNEACSSDFDCEGTLTCDPDKKLCSTKVERKLDDPCNNPGDICGKGLYCQARGAVKFCTEKNKLGEQCSIPDAPCAEDARCNGATCVALSGAAEPCDTNAECVTGFCNPDRKCQARQYASETGTCKDFGGS